MKLSVIIPFYNELDLINRTVNSVIINISFLDSVEIFIINDGKYKEEVIRSKINIKFSKFVKIISNKYSKGPGGARNTGLDISTGDIVAFLDADDFWLQGKLKAQIEQIKKGATFISTSYRLDKSKTIIYPPKFIRKPNDIFLNRGIGTSTVVVTKELLEGNRFKEIRFGQDIDFWFKLAKSKKFKFFSLQKVFTEYSTSGSTKNKWVQLYYVNKILNLNKINILTRIKVNISYITVGIYNHYIKSFIFKNKRSINE